jgi:hypothetical protein
MKPKSIVVSNEQIAQRVYFIREQRVMLSADLAELYGVAPKVLMQSVKRNIKRFPPDFMFQLTRTEFADAKSQIVTLRPRRAPRATPYAFTEQGVAMLSSVLHSERAVQVNIEIMRTFVRLRHRAASYSELARRVDDLEERVDAQFLEIFQALEQFTQEPEPAPREIGFRARERRARYATRKRKKQPEHDKIH